MRLKEFIEIKINYKYGKEDKPNDHYIPILEFFKKTVKDIMLVRNYTDYNI
jgi:hypothetical protein